MSDGYEEPQSEEPQNDKPDSLLACVGWFSMMIAMLLLAEAIIFIARSH